MDAQKVLHVVVKLSFLLFHKKTTNYNWIDLKGVRIVQIIMIHDNFVVKYMLTLNPFTTEARFYVLNAIAFNT